MRIAIAARQAETEVVVEPVFGRADFFVLVDSETKEQFTLPNLYQDAKTGAGRQAATMLHEENVEVVLCGDIGPKAKLLLGEAGIFTGIGYSGPVLKAVDTFLRL